MAEVMGGRRVTETCRAAQRESEDKEQVSKVGAEQCKCTGTPVGVVGARGGKVSVKSLRESKCHTSHAAVNSRVCRAAHACERQEF
jgi:hypothetical protein